MVTETAFALQLGSDSTAAYCRLEESRHTVVYPWLADVVAARQPRVVLDYGAGDGRFLGELHRRHRCELWYFDPTPAMREIATATLAGPGARMFKAAADIPSGQADALVSIAVWMALPTEADCLSYLHHVARSLAVRGTAHLVTTHPCFREERFSTFKTGFCNNNYLENGRSFSVELHTRAARVMLTDHHWNLSAMVGQVLRSGLAITGLHELGDRATAGSRPSPRGAPWLCLEVRRA